MAYIASDSERTGAAARAAGRDEEEIDRCLSIIVGCVELIMLDIDAIYLTVLDGDFAHCSSGLSGL
jgi:hypothetical protein